MPSIKKNVLYNTLYQILAIVVPLIISPYLARVLGADEIGKYSYTYSIVFYFLIFGMLGINNYGNRRIAIVRDRKEDLETEFWSIYSFQFFMSTMMLIIYSIVVLCYNKSFQLLLIVQGVYILSNLLDVSWFFYGLEDFRITVIRNAAVKIVSLVLILLLVKGKDDTWLYTFILSGSAFVSQLIIWPIVLNKISFRIPTWRDIKKHIKPILILFAPVLAISVFSYMDKIMLGASKGMTQTGFYECSEKIISIPKSFIQAFGAVMLPRTAHLITHGKKEESKNYLNWSIACVVIVLSACSFGLAGIASTFAPLYWGADFVECGKLISFMCPALLFSGFGNVIRTQYLIPRAKDKEYTISLVAGAGLNFILNLLLIPQYGAVGAVCATVFAELLMTLIQTALVSKEINVFNTLIPTFPFLLIGAIMFAVIKLFEGLSGILLLDFIIEFVVGAAVYSFLCIEFIIHSKAPEIVKVKCILEDGIKKLKK